MDFDFGDLGFSLDFDDLAAMEFTDGGAEDPLEGQVWSRPIARAPKLVAYEHAREMARNMVIDNQTETFAFVSGNFIFGDLIEALIDERKLTVRRLTIHTLSLNEDNIDSIRNVLEMAPVEELNLILSNYWYAHELKTGLVGYLFEELDLDGLELRVAFAGTHCKVVTLETPAGNVLTMHGSANLRSSGNVEQLHISPDRGLYEFCEGMNGRILDAYDVMNQDNRKRKRTVRRSALWHAMTATGATTSADAGQGERAPGTAEPPESGSQGEAAATAHPRATTSTTSRSE